MGNSCGNIDIADEKGYLVVLIQIVPEHVCKLLHVVRNRHQFRLSFKAGEGIAVSLVGVNEMAFSSGTIIVCKSKSEAGGRISVVACLLYTSN